MSKFSGLNPASSILPPTTIIPVVEPAKVGIEATKTTVTDLLNSMPMTVIIDINGVSNLADLPIPANVTANLDKLQDYTFVVRNVGVTAITDIYYASLAGLSTTNCLISKIASNGERIQSNIQLYPNGMLLLKYVNTPAPFWIVINTGTVFTNGVQDNGGDVGLGGGLVRNTTISNSGGYSWVFQSFDELAIQNTRSVPNAGTFKLDVSLLTAEKRCKFPNLSGTPLYSNKLTCTINTALSYPGRMPILFKKEDGVTDLDAEDYGTYIIETQSYQKVTNQSPYRHLKYGYTDNSGNLFTAHVTKAYVEEYEDYAIKVSAVYKIDGTNINSFINGTAVKMVIMYSTTTTALASYAGITNLDQVWLGGGGNISTTATRIANP